MSCFQCFRINLASVVDELKNKFNVPTDVRKFLFDRDHSLFLECNTEMAKKNRDFLGVTYVQKEDKNKMVSPVVDYITGTLESLGKHYWLAGGTLLGRLIFKPNFSLFKNFSTRST